MERVQEEKSWINRISGIVPWGLTLLARHPIIYIISINPLVLTVIKYSFYKINMTNYVKLYYCNI